MSTEPSKHAIDAAAENNGGDKTGDTTLEHAARIQQAIDVVVLEIFTRLESKTCGNWMDDLAAAKEHFLKHGDKLDNIEARRPPAHVDDGRIRPERD